MEWQGGNKQRPNYWQWRRSFILGDSNWKSFQVGYLWTCIWAQTECSAGCDLWSIFLECFEQSTSWCFGSHFFLIDSLPFATVVFWLHLKTKTKFKEKHGKKTPLSTFHCNQLQHTRSACFKTDLPDHFRFNFVPVVTEPCESVVFLWRHGGHVTETGFSAADDADARSVVFVFIQINTFTYIRKMSIYQTNSVHVKLYLYSTK